MPEIHINLIESLWAVLNLVTLYFTGLNFAESKRQKEALAPLRNGRLVIVNGNIRRDRNRLIKILAMLGIFVYAAVLPGDGNLNPFTALLFLLPLILLYDSAADNLDRRYLLRKKIAEVKKENGWDGTERRRSE